LDPQGFDRAFRELVAGVIPALRQNQMIAIDGKAAAAPLQIVSAFSAEVGLCSNRFPPMKNIGMPGKSALRSG